MFVIFSGAPKDFEADILFIIDSSKDITARDFNLQKEFIKYMANLLNTETGRSRAAVVNYGNKPMIVSTFDRFQSYEVFKKQIDDARPVGGGRRADNAFQIVSDVMKGARNNVPKVILFVGGGKQDIGSRPLNDLAEKARNTGANIFVAAVGPNVDYSVVRSVVQNQQDMVIVPLFEKLRHSANSLVQHIVRGKYFTYITLDMLV